MLRWYNSHILLRNECLGSCRCPLCCLPHEKQPLKKIIYLAALGLSCGMQIVHCGL